MCRAAISLVCNLAFMRVIRLTLRLCAICLATAGIYFVWLVGLVLLFAFKSARYRWRNFILRNWAKVIAAILGMTITVQGKPPRAPFFLVANHLSYVDIIALASRLDCVFVAKSEIRDWFIIGLLCRSFDMIFVDRNRRNDLPRVIGLMEAAWQKHQGVILFPEGTSSKGEAVLPFKPSLLEIAVRTATGVHFAALSYQTPPDERPAYLSVCWWGDMTLAPHALDLLRLREFSATLVFGDEIFIEADRKILAQKLHHAIENHFTPVVLSGEEREAVTIT